MYFFVEISYLIINENKLRKTNLKSLPDSLYTSLLFNIANVCSLQKVNDLIMAEYCNHLKDKD